MSIFDALGNATSTAYHGHKAQKEAARFAASVRPGHTYYSVATIHGGHPGLPDQVLLEWRFSKPGRWIGQGAKDGHLTAAGAWLGYGPLHATRPPGLMTHKELSRRPGCYPDAESIPFGEVRLSPAGV
jgi:hypothetical protein